MSPSEGTRALIGVKQKPPMKTTLLSLAKILSLAFVLAAPHGQAQSLLRVDFGKSNQPESPTQSGFSPFTISLKASPGPMSQQFSGRERRWTDQGRIFVTLAAGNELTETHPLLARDREFAVPASGSFEAAALYRDFIIAHNRQFMVIGLAGLKPDTVYDIMLFCYDDVEDGTALFTNLTGTGGVSATIAWTKGASLAGAKSTIFSAVMRIRSNREGEIVILNNRRLSSNVNRQAILNGLEIFAVGAE